MKLNKILSLTGILLLSACSFNIENSDVEKAKEVFNSKIDALYQMYESDGKELLASLSFESAREMIDKILEKIPEDKKEIAYKGIEKGVTILKDGKEVLANELQIDLSVEGVKEEIENFLDKLAGIEANLSVDDVIIEKVDDNYRVDCTIKFYYSSVK